MHLELKDYEIRDIDRVLTPALAIYPAIVDENIETTLRLAGGDPNRWRPHIKTAKLGFVMRRLRNHGVASFKCSTTLELRTACEEGARDVLVAYPMVGAAARRLLEIAEQYPDVRVSVLVENENQAATWRGSRVGMFIDVNPGMDRTGIDQQRIKDISQLARSLGGQYRGLHYYDGHVHADDLDERRAAAWRGYDQLLEIVSALAKSGIETREVITSGTPAFPAALKHPGLSGGKFVHQVSPGTVVYSDFTSIGQLPEDYGYRPAAVVVSTVVSHPAPGIVTCDAGHKSVSADAGVPTCMVAGHPDLTPMKPSEEHLPMRGAGDASLPSIGEALYLVPRHVCPTVNNFDEAMIVENGRVGRIERVTARGHESPLVTSHAAMSK
jgi:D-serine deaminase-like pyridoxal phosphate-dependent protein